MTTRFPKLSDFEDDPLRPASEDSSDCGFEDIVGKSPALMEVLEQVVTVSRAPIYLGFPGLAYGRAGRNEDAETNTARLNPASPHDKVDAN